MNEWRDEVASLTQNAKNIGDESINFQAPSPTEIVDAPEASDDLELDVGPNQKTPTLSETLAELQRLSSRTKTQLEDDSDKPWPGSSLALQATDGLTEKQETFGHMPAVSSLRAEQQVSGTAQYRGGMSSPAEQTSRLVVSTAGNPRGTAGKVAVEHKAPTLHDDRLASSSLGHHDTHDLKSPLSELHSEDIVD